VFKVIESSASPGSSSTPLILGLPAICSLYLELMVNSLKTGHAMMRAGKIEDSIEDEIQRLRIVPHEKILKKAEVEELVEDTGTENNLKVLSNAGELAVISDLQKISTNKFSRISIENKFDKIKNGTGDKNSLMSFLIGNNSYDYQWAVGCSWNELFQNKKSRYSTNTGIFQILVDSMREDNGEDVESYYEEYFDYSNYHYYQVGDKPYFVPKIENYVPDKEDWHETYCYIKDIINKSQSSGVKAYSRFLSRLAKLGSSLHNWAYSMGKMDVEDMIEEEYYGKISTWYQKDLDDEIYEEEVRSALFEAGQAFDKENYLKDTMSPWTSTLGESPEERDSYIPCSNTGLYNYLSTSYDEALAKYHVDAKNRTDPECWEYVKEIMNSDLAQRRFCPKEWTGMTGVEPISLKFTEEWADAKNKGIGPRGSKAFVNERMKVPYVNEFNRMRKYMYRPSKSSTASRILVADKSTPPFVRICGDYRPINKYIMIPQHQIPNIRQEIYKAFGTKRFINLDLANGYHNLVIDKEASEALALSTEWGLFEPKFMPEGIKSAPAEFQRIMREVFEPMKDTVIVIWDNLLVLCDSLEDVKNKLIQVLELCDKHNIILKMSKTEIGYTSAEFFGFRVSEKTIELTQERKDGIKALKFFRNTKGAQSFLGSTNFFRDFIPNYSGLTAELNDMTKKSFNWDPGTWKVNYVEKFEDLKEAVMNSLVLHFPDYNKLWIMRTDCSKSALGIVLFQVGDDGIYEPIAFHSEKLSDQAKNWSAVKLEAYAVYYGVKKLSYYLLGKEFIIEVDHQNLVTMENTEQYIIQRWRSYLENFNFKIKHIAGKKNLLADYQSRMFQFSDDKSAQNKPSNVYAGNYAGNSSVDKINYSLVDIFGPEDSCDPLIQLYDQRCYAQHDQHYLLQHQATGGNVDDIYSSATIVPKHHHFLKFTEFIDISEESISIYIRDPIFTSMVQAVTSNAFNSIFQRHNARGDFDYYIDDVQIDGRNAISFYIANNQKLLRIDAVPQGAIVTDISHTSTPVDPLQNPPKTHQNENVVPGEEQRHDHDDHIQDVNINDFEDIQDNEFSGSLAQYIIDLQSKVKGAMQSLHGSRKMHYSADRMYRDACVQYPGHRIPQVYFQDYVKKCATCQKSRMQKDKFFLEQVRTLKADPRPRSAVCIDRLSISPPSKNGNTTCIVISDLFTRLVRCYPCKEYDGPSVANALKDWIITYGVYDVLKSDPGKDILSDAVSIINNMWKMNREVSLVDRHESNGNERLNQEILRHLRTLLGDERAMDIWDEPDYIGFTTLCINNQINRETGLTPFIATFGDRDEAYYFLPETEKYASKSAKLYIEKLNKSLDLVRELNEKHQKEIHQERTSKTPATTHNQFRKGDLVWFRRKGRIDPDGKLFFRNKGPFRVISMRRNDVRCEHIVTNKEKVFYINDVFPVNLDTPFEDLYEVAKLDSNEFDVLSVDGHKGNPMQRSSFQFLIHFEGEAEPIWQLWTPDVMNNELIQNYCKALKCLEVLLMTSEEASKYVQSLRTAITEVKIGDKVLIDLKTFSIEDSGLWYESLGLPTPYGKRYVIEGIYCKPQRSDKGKQIGIHFPLFKSKEEYNRPFVLWYGMDKELSDDMILVDKSFAKDYPKILGEDQVEEEDITEFEETLSKAQDLKFSKGSWIYKYKVIKVGLNEYKYAYYGPLEIDKIEESVIHCSHYSTGRQSMIHKDQALASPDDNFNITIQQQIKGSLSDFPLKITFYGYEGDPLKRENMSFWIKFGPDYKDFEFMDFNLDLLKSMDFRLYCESIKCLETLLIDPRSVKQYVKDLDSKEIEEYQEKDIIFVNLRCMGKPLWYSKTGLPNHLSLSYMVRGQIIKLARNKRVAYVRFDVFSSSLNMPLSYSQFKWYVMKELASIKDGYIELTSEMIRQYPNVGR